LAVRKKRKVNCWPIWLDSQDLQVKDKRMNDFLFHSFPGPYVLTLPPMVLILEAARKGQQGKDSLPLLPTFG